MKLETYLYHNDEDIPISVNYKFHKGSRGSRDSLGGVRGAGPLLEPDDPPEIEILNIIDLRNANDLLDEIPTQDLDIIESKCWEHYTDHCNNL